MDEAEVIRHAARLIYEAIHAMDESFVKLNAVREELGDLLEALSLDGSAPPVPEVP